MNTDEGTDYVAELAGLRRREPRRRRRLYPLLQPPEAAAAARVPQVLVRHLSWGVGTCHCCPNQTLGTPKLYGASTNTTLVYLLREQLEAQAPQLLPRGARGREHGVGHEQRLHGLGVGSGRIVGLHHRSSTLYQIH